MSDDASTVKRGRKAHAEKNDKETKTKEDKKEKMDKDKELKKRPRKETKTTEVDAEEDGVAPVKRGRGRPKGSTKKKNNVIKTKGKSTTGKLHLSYFLVKSKFCHISRSTRKT